MKLSSKLKKIEKTIEDLETVQVINKSNGTLAITGLKNLQQAINNLQQIDLSFGIIDKIKSYDFFNNSSDYVIVNSNGITLSKDVESLMVFVCELEKAIKSVLNIPEEYSEEYHREEEFCIFIKLPDTNNLSSLSKDIGIYDKILSQSILDANIESKIELKTVEPGSIWLNVCLGSLAAIKLVGAMTWAAAVIYKKWNEGRYTNELIKSKKLDNKEKELLLKHEEKILDIYLETETENIIAQHYKTNEDDSANEKFTRLKNVLQMLFDQMKRGSEVIPALAESEKVENLFPDIKNLPTIESKTKKIDKE